MRQVWQKLGGTRGLLLRLRMTVAYSVTSLTALILLRMMLLPIVDLLPEQLDLTMQFLALFLFLDLVVQTIYNERAMASIIRFLWAREYGKVEQETVRNATADFLSLPRKIAIACMVVWIVTATATCIFLSVVLSLGWLKLLYVFLTSAVTSLIALVFQYSLFRRILAPTGALLLRYGEGLQSLRESFHVSARLRLTSTFSILVLSALALSGLMAYGQYIKMSGEQAGVLASASLYNVAEDLPGDSSDWPAYVAERERYEQYHLAIWLPTENRLVGNLPVPFEHIVNRIGKTSGSFEEHRSLSRVSYRGARNVVLIAVVTPQVYLSGSLVIVWVTLAILAFTFGFATFVFNLVARDIVAPFSILRRFTKDLAQGNVSEAPIVVTEDELGRLASALRSMSSGIRTMFSDLQSSLANVKESRKGIAANLREIQNRSSDQDRNVDRSFMSFNELNQALRDIADNVMVVEKAARESKDAAHDMGRYLDDIRSELAELVDTVRGGSRFIFSMIENVEASSVGVTTLSGNVERLKGQIVEIQNAFASLSAEVQSVLGVSARAAAIATEAIGSTEETSVGVSNVRLSTEQLLGELHRFREGVLRIAGVVAIISDVTEQTALLAFNAAILAAQSQDDHAKDFAVVGDEIKDLAERTEVSTKDVGFRMRAITEQADLSLDELREAVGLIQQGQLLTQLAADSVRLIGDHSGRYERDARTISEGIYYQNHNLSEILKAVEDEIGRVENVRGFTEENGRDAAALRTALDELSGFVRQMHVSSGEHTDGARDIVNTVDQIGDGIARMRRDLRKLSGGSGEVVELMNDIRATSRRNTDQTDDMSHHLKKLDMLLRSVESKLAAITFS
jgi:methyl-accepting chemotaxis protein